MSRTRATRPHDFDLKHDVGCAAAFVGDSGGNSTCTDAAPNLGPVSYWVGFDMADGGMITGLEERHFC